MKKIILPTLSCLFFLGMITGCSNETSTAMQEQELQNENVSDGLGFTFRGGSIWDGEIGISHGNGSYEITADETVLLETMGTLLKDMDIETTLVTIEISEKAALNDPLDKGYLLIAGDNAGVSIGVMLELTNNQLMLASRDRDLSGATSCVGCAQGCNLSYLLIDGKKVPYCNENGCIYDCTQKETKVFSSE